MRANPMRVAPAILLLLAACSNLQPFETSIINPSPDLQAQTTAGVVAKQAEQAAIAIDPTIAPVSICYNRMVGTPDQVLVIAKQECGQHPPVLLEQKLDLDSCPLLTPIRITFRCRL